MMKKLIERLPLAGVLAGAALLLSAGAAEAMNLDIGGTNAKLDTTVSVGVGVRTSGQDCTKVGVPNGGCKDPNGYNFGTDNDNSDILNKRWNPFTTIAKVVSELSVSYENYGAFVRGKAYYDYWGQEQLGDHSSRFTRQPIDYQTGNATDFNRQGYGAKLLDAFVYGKYDMGSSSLNVRLGNQVVNWGESLFIQGGINSFQPIDIGAIVKPGSELKEAYQPDPMIYAQLTLPGNLGLEAFYKFGWNKSQLPVSGSFFGGYASADGIAPGLPFLPFGTDFAQAVGGFGTSAAAAEAGLLVRRQEDHDPSNQGQFGAKVGYYADWLNNGTDMGLYFTHFHSSLPYLDFTVSMPDSTNISSLIAAGIVNPTAVDFGAFATTLVGVTGAKNQQLANYFASVGGACAGHTAPGQACGGNGAPGSGFSVPNMIAGSLLSTANNMRYLTNYAPNISSIGYSFNTVLADILNGTALSGEVNFTPNMPFQRDVFAGILGNNLTVARAATAVGAPGFDAALTADGEPVNSDIGSIITPWAKYRSLTAQIGTVSTLPSTNPITAMTGSDLVILVGNAGFQYIPNLRNNSFLSGSHSTFNSINALSDSLLGQGFCRGNPAGAGNPTQICPGANNYYANSFSWGYRLTALAQYNSAFGTPWTVTPSIAWSHDVKGISAGPIGPGFVEGIKSISIGTSASYQGTWQVSVDWTTSFGNKFLNDNIDKDYATATVSYAF